MCAFWRQDDCQRPFCAAKWAWVLEFLKCAAVVQISSGVVLTHPRSSTTCWEFWFTWTVEWSVFYVCAYAEGILCLCGRVLREDTCWLWSSACSGFMEADPITMRLQKLLGCCAAGIHLLWHGWCAVHCLKKKILQIIPFSCHTWDKWYLNIGMD